jgi:hypothetical protein
MKKNVALLIGIIFGFLVASLFTSCKKEPITPGNYTTQAAPVDTSHWQNGYTNGGSTPTWGTPNNTNPLFGTNWVLTDVYNNYAHTAKNDTIHFVSNTKYTVGSDTTKWSYSLTSTMGNGSISFYQFNPINGLYLSASNFNPNAFTSTPIGGTILLNLKDNFTSTNNLYTSTFKKI